MSSLIQDKHRAFPIGSAPNIKSRALVSPSTKVRNMLDTTDSLQSLGMVKVKSLKNIKQVDRGENHMIGTSNKLRPYRPLTKNLSTKQSCQASLTARPQIKGKAIEHNKYFKSQLSVNRFQNQAQALVKEFENTFESAKVNRAIKNLRKNLTATDLSMRNMKAEHALSAPNIIVSE